jgi:DNA-directed RNA polymerase specialized sigma subunit
MKPEKIRWRIAQREIDRLSASLKPIRTCREVADMMGVSVALVCQLENSALGKIMRAVHEYDNVGASEENEINKQDGVSNHE